MGKMCKFALFSRVFCKLIKCVRFDIARKNLSKIIFYFACVADLGDLSIL